MQAVYCYCHCYFLLTIKLFFKSFYSYNSHTQLFSSHDKLYFQRLNILPLTTRFVMTQKLAQLIHVTMAICSQLNVHILQYTIFHIHFKDLESLKLLLLIPQTAAKLLSVSGQSYYSIWISRFQRWRTDNVGGQWNEQKMRKSKYSRGSECAVHTDRQSNKCKTFLSVKVVQFHKCHEHSVCAQTSSHTTCRYSLYSGFLASSRGLRWQLSPFRLPLGVAVRTQFKKGVA